MMERQRAMNPGLRSILAEASQALERLDANRLEEMALSCEALMRDSESGIADTDSEAKAEKVANDMAIFARVLDATRANLRVMRRLHEVRAAQLDYGPAVALGSSSVESEHGDH